MLARYFLKNRIFPTINSLSFSLCRKEKFLPLKSFLSPLQPSLKRNYALFTNSKEITIKDLLRREAYLAVRKKLEEDQREKISLDEYLNLCTKIGLTQEEAKHLAESLTDSGIIFFLPSAENPLIARTILLNPKKLSALIQAPFEGKPLFSGVESIQSFQNLKAEYDNLLKQKINLDHRALIYSNFWILTTGFYMIFQACLLAQLTWFTFSWDIMEPITYFITFGTGIVGWMYFTLTKTEWTYQNLRDKIADRRRAKLYKRSNYDLKRFEKLKPLFQNFEPENSDGISPPVPKKN